MLRKKLIEMSHLKKLLTLEIIAKISCYNKQWFLFFKEAGNAFWTKSI